MSWDKPSTWSTIGGTTSSPTPTMPSRMQGDTSRIERLRGTRRRWKKSTAGPSATARKPAMKIRMSTDRTRYRTYTSAASPTIVKKTFAIRAVLRLRASIGPPRLWTAPDGAGSAAPAEKAGHAGDAPTDDEARDGRADEDLLMVALDLLAPVGDLGDLAAQGVQRPRQVCAIALDRRPELLW